MRHNHIHQTTASNASLSAQGSKASSHAMRNAYGSFAKELEAAAANASNQASKAADAAGSAASAAAKAAASALRAQLIGAAAKAGAALTDAASKAAASSAASPASAAASTSKSAASSAPSSTAKAATPGKAASEIDAYKSIHALGEGYYPEIRDTIAKSDITAGYFVGKTKTYTNQEVKDFMATNPTAQQLAEKAANLNLSASNMAQALAIGGSTYDLEGVKSWIAASDSFALGPDNIVVKMAPGQTKNAEGLLQGSWSSDPGRVSYTEWARDWYAAGNGAV